MRQRPVAKKYECLPLALVTKARTLSAALVACLVVGLALVGPSAAFARGDAHHAAHHAIRAGGPALKVSGYTLTWHHVNHVSRYVLATSRQSHGKLKTSFRTVQHSSYLPPRALGETVRYKLRVNGPGTGWGNPVVIKYPATSTTAPTTAAKTPATPSTPAALATSPSSTSPLRVALMGITLHAYVPNLVDDAKSAGISWDRIDVGDGSDISAVQDGLAMGIKSLVLYNPGLAGVAPSTAAAQVRALALKLVPLGLDEIEFGNEVFSNGSTPQSYAAQYAAAHAAIAGLGITLIANAEGDYELANGNWSQDANGGGWIHDFIAALPSPGASMVDAWSVHPYGSTTSIGSGDDSGWLEIPRYHSLAVANGSSAPWYVTEVGQCTGGSGCSDATTQQGQATAFTQYLSDTVSKYSYVKFLCWYEVIDDATGDFGLVNMDGTVRPGLTALHQFMSANSTLVAG
jgi:hypothetical protein